MEEIKTHQVIGETRDIIRYKDGRIIDTGWGRNMIVEDFSILVASLLKQEAGMQGIQYWSIGSGEETWDIPPIFEELELAVNSNATTNGTVTITLDGVNKNVSVNAGDSATTVAGKIRSTGFPGWATGGVGNRVTFKASTDGNKTDGLYNAGTTGAVGTMETIVQGIKGNPRPDPKVTDKGCNNEFYRKKINADDIKFVYESGTVTDTPTNRLQISILFDENEAVGNWREFAIIGGNATNVLGTGLPINHRTHGLIEKTSTMTIERIIRFTFR